MVNDKYMSLNSTRSRDRIEFISNRAIITHHH
jgi:hypothetical protein